MIRYKTFEDVPESVKEVLWEELHYTYDTKESMRGPNYDIIGGDVIVVNSLFDLHYIRSGGKSLLEAPIDVDNAYRTEKWYVIFIADNDAGGNCWFIPKSIASNNPDIVVNRLEKEAETIIKKPA